MRKHKATAIDKPLLWKHLRSMRRQHNTAQTYDEDVGMYHLLHFSRNAADDGWSCLLLVHPWIKEQDRRGEITGAQHAERERENDAIRMALASRGANFVKRHFHS